MARLAVLALTLAACACTKSAANQDTGAGAPGGGSPKKIVVPTDEGMPSGGGLGGSSGEFVPTKGGASDRFKLQPSEGKLAIDLPADAKAGAEATAKLSVTPGAGFKVNDEYPVELTLTAPSGVTLAKSAFKAGGSDKAKGDADQLDEKALIISVKLTPAAAGNYTINGTFKFAVCDHDQCLAKKETIALQIAAK